MDTATVLLNTNGITVYITHTEIPKYCSSLSTGRVAKMIGTSCASIAVMERDRGIGVLYKKGG